MHSKLKSPTDTARIFNKKTVKLHTVNLHYRAKKNCFALIQ
jgi:hypothetical protein